MDAAVSGAAVRQIAVDGSSHQGETVLITGASSGIGRQLARLFAADGARLVLVARGADRLGELAGELATAYGAQARVVSADLSRPAGPAEIVRVLAEDGIEVDVLVNNAGFGLLGPVAGISVDRQMEMIEVNVAALTRLTALLLPGMLERRRGAIVNIASTAGFQAGPQQAVYFATKAYVLSFTEALAEEVRGSGVRVCCLAPGPTDTVGAARAGMGSTRLFRWGVMDADTVAQAGHDGLRRGKCLVVPGLRNRMVVFSVRLMPRVLATRIAGYLQGQASVPREKTVVPTVTRARRPGTEHGGHGRISQCDRARDRAQTDPGEPGPRALDLARRGRGGAGSVGAGRHHRHRRQL